MAARRSPWGPITRGMRVGLHMAAGGVLTTEWLRDQLGLSKAQAKRYMLIAETELRADATVGRRVELRLGAGRGVNASPGAA